MIQGALGCGWRGEVMRITAVSKVTRGRDVRRPRIDLRHKPCRDSLVAHEVVIAPADGVQLLIGDLHVSGAASNGEPVDPIRDVRMLAQTSEALNRHCP